MKPLVLAALFVLALAAPAWAGFDEGFAASERGDYATALREWRPLADQGDADAQNNLGVRYDKGQGVPQDFVQAHMWYNLAGMDGPEFAANNRDIIAEKMTPADVSKAQRLAREWLEKHPKSD